MYKTVEMTVKCNGAGIQRISKGCMNNVCHEDMTTQISSAHTLHPVFTTNKACPILAM